METSAFHQDCNVAKSIHYTRTSDTVRLNNMNVNK